MAFSLLLLVSLLSAIPQPTSTGCSRAESGQEVAPEIHDQVADLLATLQNAARQDDKRRIARLLHYPVSVSTADGDRLSLKNEAAFEKYYSRIFTATFKSMLLNQKVQCINRMGDRGWMVHEGEIWFEKYPDGRLRIMSFNPLIPNPSK